MPATIAAAMPTYIEGKAAAFLGDGIGLPYQVMVTWLETRVLVVATMVSWPMLVPA
jgi:hypothetical protein